MLIPIYPNTLAIVPKPSRASRTASLVVSNLTPSQSAITCLLNRFGGPETSDEGSNSPLVAQENPEFRSARHEADIVGPV